MTTRTATMTRVSQLWDLIETCGFRKNINDIIAAAADDDDDDNNNNDNDEGISALGLDRDLGFSQTRADSRKLAQIR